MNNKKRSKSTKKYTLVFMLIALAIILSLSLGTVSAADWTVGPGGTHNYTSIQDAINNASTLSGDTISVYDNNGTPYTYNENVVVNKTNLTVRSTGQVTVSGSSNPANPVFTINNQGAYAYITGFILSGATNSAGVLVTDTNDVTLNNITINNCQQGVQMTGTSTNITLDGANINGTTAQGIFIGGTAVNTVISNVSIINSTQQAIFLPGDGGIISNLVIDDVMITDCKSIAIQKEALKYLDNITITNTQIINPGSYGIHLDGDYYALTNVVIDNVSVSQADSYGIAILMNSVDSQNLTITNTTSNDNGGSGFYLVNMRGTINITNNILHNNGNWGAYILGTNNPIVTLNNNNISNNGNGLLLQSISGGNFQDNQLINNTGDDLYATGDTNNTFTRLTLGFAHPTTVTFDYINGIIMNGVESPSADPSGLFNIGKYVDMQGLGSTTVNLKVHYNDSDVVYLNEASLKNFHFNTNWSELPQPNGVNTTERYVYADGISSFSTFAPLGEKPPTMLNVTDVSGLNGQTVNLEATLSIQGTPIAGKTVHFTVNGISIGSNVTDDNGIATLNYLITLIPGTYTINATFNGDGDYTATDATSTLTVYKNNTSIVVNDVTGVNSQNVQLKAILTNQDGTPLIGKTIEFTVNGTSVGSAVTEGTGQAILNLQIPSNWTLGNKTIQAEFLGTDSYNTSQNTATLTVEVKPTAKANIKGGLFNANKNVYLSRNKPGTIYYTRNGSTPTTASTKYTGYLTISSTTTLRFIAVDLGGNISPVYTEKYVIDKTAPKVTYTYPRHLRTGQSRTATLYLKFSESLKASTYWSKIYVKDLKTGKKVSITKYIKGNILYIKTKYKRASLRWFQVYVPYKAVKDYAGNNLARTYTYKFKTRR
jgi:hypothetical protein